MKKSQIKKSVPASMKVHQAAKKKVKPKLYLPILDQVQFTWPICSVFVEEILDKVEEQVVQKQLQQRCNPFAVEESLGRIVAEVKLNLLIHDTNEQFEPDYEEQPEPVGITVENYLPKSCNLVQKNETVVVDEMSKPDTLLLGAQGGSDQGSFTYMRRLTQRSTLSLNKKKDKKKETETSSVVPLQEDPFANMTAEQIQFEKDLQREIDYQRKKIIRKEHERKLAELEKKRRRKRAAMSYEVKDFELQNKEYYIEDGGRVIFIKKQRPDALPRQYAQGVILKPKNMSSQDDGSQSRKQLLKKGKSQATEQSLSSMNKNFNEKLHKFCQQKVEKYTDNAVLNTKRKFKPQDGVSYIEQSTFQKMTEEERRTFDKKPYEERVEMLKSNKQNKIGNRYSEHQKAKRFSVDEYRRQFDTQNTFKSKHEDIAYGQMLADQSLQQATQGQSLDTSSLVDISVEKPERRLPSIKVDQQQEIIEDRSFYSYNMNESKVPKEMRTSLFEKSLRGPGMTIQADPSILLEDSISEANKTGLITGLGQKEMQGMFPKMFGHTPKSVYQNYSRRNSMLSKDDLNQNSIIYNYDTNKEISKHQLPEVTSLKKGKPSLNALFNSSILKDKSILNRTTNNSPVRVKLGSEQLLQMKQQPQQVLEHLKQKMKNKDKTLTLGRDMAFGIANDYKVKKLRNEHWLNTARNQINKRKYSEEISEPKNKALPPPELGKTLGHGILKE